MLNIFLGAPIVGILFALAAVVSEQLLAVFANIFFQKEIMLDVYTHLNFFLVAVAIIEESLKFLAIGYILRQIFALRRFRFIAAATISGLFFALTEIYLILLTNGKSFRSVQTLDGDTLFALLAVLLIHILTALLIGVLMASRDQSAKFKALKTIVPPAFVHLLINFLIIEKGNFTHWLVIIALGITFAASLSIVASNFRELD